MNVLANSRDTAATPRVVRADIPTLFTLTGPSIVAEALAALPETDAVALGVNGPPSNTKEKGMLTGRSVAKQPPTTINPARRVGDRSS